MKSALRDEERFDDGPGGFDLSNQEDGTCKRGGGEGTPCTGPFHAQKLS